MNIETIESAEKAAVELFTKEGYTHVRRLPDNTYAGLTRLMFTTAICTGLDYFGWAYRYCYESPARALEELNKLKSMDDTPTGFVARR